MKKWLITLAALTMATGALAEAGTWTGTNGTSWQDAGNWSGTTYPTNNEIATFNGDGNGNTTIDVETGSAADRLNFETGSAAYTIGTGEAGSQTIDITGSNSSGIYVKSGVTTDQTINADVQGSDDQNIDVYNSATGTTLTFNGNFLDNKYGNWNAVEGATINLNGTGNTANNGGFSGGGTLNANSFKSNKSFTTLWGTVNLNNTQNIGNLKLGDTEKADGDATFNIVEDNTVTATTQVGYLADVATANRAYITGGNLKFSTADLIVDDNTLVSAPELTISAAIIGADTDGAIVKTGAGTVAFTGANTYLAETTVSEGTLLINGDNSAATGAVTIDAGAILGGSGTIGGETTVDGMLKPGNSPGTLTFLGALNLNSGSETTFEIASDSSFDILMGNADNTVAFADGSEIIFDFTGNTEVNEGDTYTVLANWDGMTSAATITTVGLDTLTLNTDNLFSTGTINVVPEPATIGLLGLGGLITLLARRKMRF